MCYFNNGSSIGSVKIALGRRVYIRCAAMARFARHNVAITTARDRD
jgi:hypothetical protein